MGPEGLADYLSLRAFAGTGSAKKNYFHILPSIIPALLKESLVMSHRHLSLKLRYSLKRNTDYDKQ